MKKCTKCKVARSLSEFGLNKRSRDGLHWWCKSCVRAQNKRYYHANRDLEMARSKKWAKENPERYRELVNESHRRSAKKIKQEVVSAYGGSCSCCGESEINFLTLDHVNGRSSVDTLRGEKMYRQAKREQFPDCYRVLCFNCNCSIGFYGYCPHELRSSSST